MPSGKPVVLLREWSGEIDGLGPAADMPLGLHTLESATRAAVHDAGLQVVQTHSPMQDTLLLPNPCALGPDALRAVLDVACGGGDARIVLGGELGELLSMASLAGGLGVVFLKAGVQGGVEERERQAPIFILDPKERSIGELAPGGEALVLSDRLILPVNNWLGLLWANLLLLPPTLWGELIGRGPWALWSVLRALVLAGPRRIPQGLTRGGQVHPDAIVEASLLSPGAKVEAGAVVRGCILGPGARVEALAVCEGCVLGPDAVVQRQALIKYSVLGPGAAIGGATQLSVLAAGASLKRGSFGMDQNLKGRPVRILVDGCLEPVPLGMAGACLAQGALVGSGVWVAPGRVLPAGAVVVGDSVLSRSTPPAGAQGPYVVRDGGLEPL